MGTYQIILRSGGSSEERHEIGAQGLTIGRSPECDVVLADPLVSRRHAWIGIVDEQVVVEDCGSVNGVYVDGQPLARGVVQPGALLGIGDFTLLLYHKSGLAEDSTLISFQEAGRLYEAMLANEAGGRPQMLYKAAQLLGSVFDLDELLAEILDVIFEAVPAKRGFILIHDAQGREPEVRASLVRDVDGTELPLSRTLIDHVLHERSAILTHNAQQDGRFGATDSIIGHRIREAMCAPLLGRNGVVGAIYVDAGDGETAMTEPDLELLTAICRVVGVAVENAELYRANLEQERLAAIGQATAGLGHCVKNILTGLKTGGEFMDEALARDDIAEVRRAWPLVRTAAGRIEDLMLDLLTFSRKRKPHFVPVDLNDICAEAAEVVRRQAALEDVAVTMAPGTLGVFEADGREIFRVVLNLLMNAVDACKANGGGAVAIATRRDPRGCYITVRDDGPGIPESIRPDLFKAFVTTKGSRGTGLGLACCQKIADEHGGAIHCESAPGEGAAFTVFLPYQTADRAPTTGVDLDQTQHLDQTWDGMTAGHD